MKNSNKYSQMNMAVPDRMMQELRQECFRLRISRQAFIRALIHDYFIRNHGKDLALNQVEPINLKGGKS